MKQSGYLARERAIRREYAAASERLTRQFLLDTLQVTLHTEFGFGYDRIMRLTDAWSKTYDLFHEALEGGNEADYWQVKLDRMLAEVIRDRQPLIPFEKRYPELKEITYGPKK